MRVVLFLVVMFIGLCSLRSPNTDEKYTAKGMDFSYGKILRGGINEGCNSPLWYMIEKLVGGVKSGKIASVVCIALAISMIGWYGLLMLPLIWPYFSEARPYALVVLLAVMQMLFINRRMWGKVLVVNFLMSFTFFGLVIPIVSSAIVMKKWILGLPLLISGWYYFYAPHYNFYLKNSAWLKIVALIMVCLLFRKNKFFLYNAIGALIVMTYFWFKPIGQFQVSERYFIFLIPIAIIAMKGLVYGKEKGWQEKRLLNE